MAMIQRSTLVFLTCLTALGTPAMRAENVASAESLQQPDHSLSEQLIAQASQNSQGLIAQASGGNLAGELDVNAKGEAVRALQLRLQQSGYYNGLVDGIYGLDTQRAVIEFQAASNLEQTGSLNDETYQKLRALSETKLANNAAANASNGGTNVPGSETAPTVGDLPPIGNAPAPATASVAAENKGDNLGKVFGLGLGIAALLASFGVGLFVANRSKSNKPEEGLWGEIEPSTNLSQAGLTRTTTKALPLVPTFSQPGDQQTRGNATVNGNSAAINGGMAGSITSATHSLSTNGQVSGTAPLAQADVIDGLIGDLHNPDPSRRRKAIWELGQRGNSLAMQPLVDSMVDADSKEKSLVLAALSEIGIRSLKPMSRALAIALQDNNPEVRKNAIRDLTRVYDLVVQISQMLGHATEDEDPEVRQTATWALDQLNRIRRSQDIDANIRTFSGSSSQAAPIDLLSSEASLRRSQQGQ